MLNFALKFGVIVFSGVGLTDLIDSIMDIVRGARRPKQTSTSTNLEKLGLYRPGDGPELVHKRIDAYIKKRSSLKSNFTPRSLPIPFGIKRNDVVGFDFKWRLILHTEYESHDFGISPFRRKALELALKEAKFLT